MKDLRLLFFIFFLPLSPGQSQEKRADPINVILLGTFHYGSTTDANRTDFPDLFSERRQRELDQLTERLAELEIDKIFIERPVERQAQYDSLYALYLSEELSDTVVLRPEEIQIGFRLARKAQLRRVHCVNVIQELPYDKLQAFEDQHEGQEDASFFQESSYPFGDASQQLNLAEETLSEYYVKSNNHYHQQRRLYDFLHHAMSYVDQADFTGPEFTGVWYDRNLKIFSNMLNSLTPQDKTILVLFGSSHTDLFEYFFASNPHFNVIPLDTILAE